MKLFFFPSKDERFVIYYWRIIELCFGFWIFSWENDKHLGSSRRSTLIRRPSVCANINNWTFGTHCKTIFQLGEIIFISVKKWAIRIYSYKTAIKYNSKLPFEADQFIWSHLMAVQESYTDSIFIRYRFKDKTVIKKWKKGLYSETAINRFVCELD